MAGLGGEVLKTTLRLGNSQEASQDSECGCTLSCDLLQQKYIYIPSTVSKGKGTRGEVWGTKFLRSFSSGVTQDVFNSPDSEL